MKENKLGFQALGYFYKLFVRSKTEELVYQIKLPLLTFLKSRVK